ncbi:MAG: helix-turn-helix domain-containing protein [Bacteroidetes bacterium]|nr:helix-turn-helix domain-containing protein [Bacteroidota bacterium]
MDEVIFTQMTLTRLGDLIQDSVKKAIADTDQTQQPEESDRINLSEACKITGLSKSKIYKLSMDSEIPKKKFNGKLVFSRKELVEWMDQNTTEDRTREEMSEHLANIAQRRTA